MFKFISYCLSCLCLKTKENLPIFSYKILVSFYMCNDCGSTPSAWLAWGVIVLSQKLARIKSKISKPKTKTMWKRGMKSHMSH